MKRILLAIAMLFSVNVALAGDKTLWTTDEICNVASTTAGTIAKDTITENTVTSTNYDLILQIMAWRAWTDTQNSAGIRAKQLANANLGFLYLREVQFSLTGSIKRAMAKHGRSKEGIVKAKDAVSQEMYDQCMRTESVEVSPLTVGNPYAKEVPAPKVQL